MKRITMVVVSILVVATLVLGASTVMADKPPKPPHSGEGNQLIPRPNGFPAGPHYNLNIHGKKVGFACNETPGGGSVFVDEYGPATIQYVSNKKGPLTELMVLDPCAVNNGTAKVQLPHEAEGYYVFGRILGKPNNSSNDGDASSIILYPNVVVQACNDTGVDPGFGNYTSCPGDPLLALGFLGYNQAYVAENETYVRFDPGVTKGKGKSKATDMTALFTYVGWVVHSDLDIWGAGNASDGVIDDYDVPGGIYGAPGNATAEVLAANKTVADYDCPFIEGQRNCNGKIDLIEEWLAFQADIDPPMAWYFSEGDGMWIFNIADLVVTEQGLVNDGTKLLQIRFYPKDGTTFEE
jgi:hypothetical protein